MPKHFRVIAAFIAALILMTGCSNQPVANQTTETSSVQFGPQTSQTAPEPTDPSPDMNETSVSDHTEASSAEAPSDAPTAEKTTPEETAPEETTPEETTPEETTPEETTPEETTPEESSREIITFAPVEETVYATDFVNLRADYSLDSEILTLLGPGNAITRVGYHEEWSMIRFNGEICYISSNYVTTVAPPTEAPEPTEPAPPVIVIPDYHHQFMANLSNITFTGRWFTKDYNGYTHYTTLNAGSELSFQISGVDCISVYFSSIHGGDCTFSYSIDGLTPVKQPILQPYVYLGGFGTHTVRIMVDSIGDDGDRWGEGVGIGIDGIEFHGGVVSPWKYSNTLIAFYGDSITEGIRTLPYRGHSYVSSYTWSCSQALGALPIVCGFPGSGLTTTGTFNTCANAITNYSAHRGSENFSPAVVVLSHGTNDVNADSGAFSAAYNQVLDMLHAKFPNVKIACMIPVSQIHADDIRGCVAEKDWCVAIETDGWNISYTDNIHPDAASSQEMGHLLSLALQSLMN